MEPQNRGKQLLHNMGKKIVGGEWPPGHVLPKVELLSDMNGVSRTVTREALKGLEARNLVGSQPKVGTTIQPRSNWQWWNRDVLHWAVDASNNRQFLRQLTEVRMAIEPAVVSIAAKNATREDIEEIRNQFAILSESVGDETAWATADYDFHDSILRASHNELMVSLVQTMREALLYSRRTTVKILRETTNAHSITSDAALTLHRTVMDAISEGNSDLAYTSMRALLEAVAGLVEDMDESRSDV